MWADIILKHPEIMEILPDDIYYLNWAYSDDPSEENVAKFKKMLEPVLRHYYGAFTADDFLNSRFGYLEKLMTDTMELVKQTKKM